VSAEEVEAAEEVDAEGEVDCECAELGDELGDQASLALGRVPYLIQEYPKIMQP